jgi:hypothetical protein
VSFPAFESLGAEIGLGQMTWRVYRHLQLEILDFETFKEVKVWFLCETLKLSKRSVCRALNWLVDQGYLLEHERAHGNSIRSFKLAYRKTPKPAKVA